MLSSKLHDLNHHLQASIRQDDVMLIRDDLLSMLKELNEIHVAKARPNETRLVKVPKTRPAKA